MQDTELLHIFQQHCQNAWDNDLNRQASWVRISCSAYTAAVLQILSVSGVSIALRATHRATSLYFLQDCLGACWTPHCKHAS